MTTRRRFLTMAGATVLACALPAAARAVSVRVQTGPAFGSAWRLVTPATREAERARDRVEGVLAQIDALMSPFRADSELARFNASGIATVSADTRTVVLAALELAQRSGGAFDPTLAPLGRRYGFGAPPIAPTRPAGSCRDIHVAAHAVRTARPGLSLDLCGIAKGHALDRVAQALDGLEFLLELGGEVVARGRHPSGRRWRTGIEQPGSESIQRVIAMDARSIATSGDAIQGYALGARRYSHVIDRSTRAPAAAGVASVSVLAASGMLADGLATAAMVLGPEATRPLLAAYDAGALFIMRRGQALEEVTVNGFPEGSAA